MDQKLPELYQFRYAMYPEKARWALDINGIKHGRRSTLPGLHPPVMIKLAKQTATPVLKLSSGELLKNSTAIVEWADQQGNAKLYPAEHRRQIQQLVAEFDDLGPHVRRAYFQELLKAPDYAARLFAYGFPEATQKRYARSFGLIKFIMRVDMKINARSAAKSRKQVTAALDRVAELSAETGYLVGDSFTAADLTAATVLNICCLPKQYPVPLPRPLPAALADWRQDWASHPAIAWVQRMYAQHRPNSAAVYDIGCRDTAPR